MKFDSLQFNYEDAGRPEIIECVNSAMKRYLNGDECTGFMIAPRVGKQSLVVLLANEARAQGAPFVHCIVPWANLNNQIVDVKRNKRTFHFYKAYGTTRPFRADIVENIPHHKYYCNYKNPPTLLTSTIQLLYSNINVAVEAVRYAIRTTGKRPIYIVDEVQLMGLGLPWYEMMKKLIEAGAYIVSMTGTEKRIDKKPIIGFELLEVDGSETSKVASQFKGIEVNDEGKKIASLAIGTQRSAEFEVKPIGSIPIPISMAFDRGWCAPLEVKTFDFEIMDMSDGSRFLISEASQKKNRANLVDWLQSDECIRTAVKHVLDDLIRRRVDLGLSNAKAMFITLSDIDPIKKKGNKASDEGANYHARKIKKEFLHQLALLPPYIRKSLGRINAEICTSMLSNGDPDSAAIEKLRRFTFIEMDDNGKEPIDILFVKNMGVVGLDVPQLKTMVNLSNYSADAPTTLQANLRIATNWDESDTKPLLILPASYQGRKFRDTCGNWSDKIVVSTFEEDSIEERVIEESSKEHFEVVDGSGRVHSYSDHKGQVIEGDMERIISAVRRKYKAVNQLSYYQLVETIKLGAFPLSDEDFIDPSVASEEAKEPGEIEVINVSEQRESAKEDEDGNDETFGKKANRLTSELVGYDKNNPGVWKQMYKMLVANAKTKCGFNKYESVTDVVDPEVLTQLKYHLDTAYMDLKSKMDAVVV